jgi:hypothetical protein
MKAHFAQHVQSSGAPKFRGLAIVAMLALSVLGAGLPLEAAPGSSRRVYAPHFTGEVQFNQTAIFWLGKVTPTNNYADTRVGYNDDELWVHVVVIDRRLWYDGTPSSDTLAAWDAVTVLVSRDGAAGNVLDANDYRFTGQLNWGKSEGPRAPWQSAARGDGSQWSPAALSFTTESSWRGDAPNSEDNDRGWNVTFRIPFETLGIANAPSPQTQWRLGVVVHDRDDAAGTLVPDQVWPETMDAEQPGSWGQLVFGLPAYTPPSAVTQGVTTIRDGLNGAAVRDGMVGGSSNCGASVDDWWLEWGEASYPSHEFFNVQNQHDVADWPCFSKYYVTFPLDSVPPDKVILAATLQLHQFGNAGAGWDPGPTPSYLQVLTVAEDWGATLTWNNAPLAQQNVGGAWVDPFTEPVPREGADRQWNVSAAVAQAYAAGQPLRLAVYSADADYHSGRYFRSSKFGDAAERPTLFVRWGDPGAKAFRALLPYTTR